MMGASVGTRTQSMDIKVQARKDEEIKLKIRTSGNPKPKLTIHHGRLPNGIVIDEAGNITGHILEQTDERVIIVANNSEGSDYVSITFELVEDEEKTKPIIESVEIPKTDINLGEPRGTAKPKEKLTPEAIAYIDEKVKEYLDKRIEEVQEGLEA